MRTWVEFPKPEACEVQSLEDSGWEELPKMQKASQELEKRKDDAEKVCGAHACRT